MTEINKTLTDDEQIDKIRKLPRPWCGDNSCLFGKPEGPPRMATNGGCRCFEERSVMKLPEVQRIMLNLSNAVPHLLRILDQRTAELAKEKRRAELSARCRWRPGMGGL